MGLKESGIEENRGIEVVLKAMSDRLDILAIGLATRLKEHPRAKDIMNDFARQTKSMLIEFFVNDRLPNNTPPSEQARKESVAKPVVTGNKIIDSMLPKKPQQPPIAKAEEPEMNIPEENNEDTLESFNTNDEDGEERERV